jgi:hydrogenase/urease accessory protein HupE
VFRRLSASRVGRERSVWSGFIRFVVECVVGLRLDLPDASIPKIESSVLLAHVIKPWKKI